jgi:hypothetical protein
MTIAEMLARKALAAGTPAAAPGKPVARPLVLRAGMEPEAQLEPPRAAEVERRSLAGVRGETMPLTPANATPEEALWHMAAQGLDSELCAARHPQDPETAWLALRHPSNRALPMLLLHPLPWVLFETATPAAPPAVEDEPY